MTGAPPAASSANDMVAGVAMPNVSANTAPTVTARLSVFPNLCIGTADKKLDR